MQDIEPHYRWRDLYRAEDDHLSPFYNRQYSEFEYYNKVYNYVIHPQWDEFGSPTLYIKILYADYNSQYVIIEMIGEWNDAVTNDVMFLKREVLEPLMQNGINKYILIGENILNFHGSDDCYYEEWFNEIEDGWIVALNFQEHVLEEFRSENIDYYINFGGELDNMLWRKLNPQQLYNQVKQTISKRLM
jgi:hypothetical protein